MNVERASTENVSEIASKVLQEDILKQMISLTEELSSKQEALLSKLEEQNCSAEENEAVDKVHGTMLRTHQYYKKLLQIRRDMMELHSRSAKVKERARSVMKAQEQNAVHRQQRKLAQEQKEKQLIAKPANKS